MINSLQNIMISKTLRDQKKQQQNNIIQSVIVNRKLKIPYPLKTYYNSVIPLNIFQTWHTKSLPPLMLSAVNKIKMINPRFKYCLYDDNECREFIKHNFPEDVLYAYDTLIPGAYKADLWRYCILYKEGGIYLDIKYKPLNKFKFISLTEAEHWVLDMDGYGIYNALIVSKPENPILFAAIRQVVENVKKRYYGSNCLEPTGPYLLANYFNQDQKNSFDMKHDFISNINNRFVYFNNYAILKSYNGYLDEHNHNKKVHHYGYLWNIKKIYK
jgi:mannosyltransferase OCH1-like enzyme